MFKPIYRIFLALLVLFSLTSASTLTTFAQSTCQGAGRIDSDCDVDIFDFYVLIDHFGQTSSDPLFLAAADLDQSGEINGMDFYVLVANFGNVYTEPTATPTAVPPTATPTAPSPTNTPAVPTPTSTPPVPTATPTSTPPTPTPTANPNAQYPSDLTQVASWTQWKMTLPSGVEQKNLINFRDASAFFVNPADGVSVVFKTLIDASNGTTPNSSNIRSELRERTSNGQRDICWDTAGKHSLYVKQKITHLTRNVPIMVASQVHGDKSNRGEGAVDDSAVLRLENNHLMISFNGGSDLVGSNGQRIRREPVTVSTNYQLGTMMEFIMEIDNNKHRFYYSTDGNLETAYNNGNATQYLVRDPAQANTDVLLDLPYGNAYFKAGNYTQSNYDKENGDTNNNYGEVILYKTWVAHQHAAGANLVCP